jgi:alkylated DNA repair dioxygenase AlkB
MEIKEIPGLTLKNTIITPKYEKGLVTFIEAQPWQDSLKRQVQQYGEEYSYKTRSLTYKNIPIPEELLTLANAVGLPNPDNIIINKYMPGQGISPHTDSNVFGDVIASLSLLSDVPMDFNYKSNYHTVHLEPRSLIILSGEARTHWTHGIVARKSDVYLNVKKPRATRISITFRTLRNSESIWSKTEEHEEEIKPKERKSKEEIKKKK